ncbi:hypothetical protein H9657_02855 [Cellulomonas sp. Sa3CUA2]|uniref:Uncharacterized protein n=1 Tax=Cellulomonas avistercoris TaxID=2762242 RepID=A0ABR8Q9V6_9CELL|nr:hypothetical protein [Cellulomonas avistercoris]MBD7917216.1 hypothetical protein [Cellulomonas avistercoris]
MLLALIGVAAFVTSAVLNSTAVSSSGVGNFFVVALFLASGSVVLKGQSEAVQYVTSLACGTSAYYILAYVFGFGPVNIQSGFAELWKYGLAYPMAILATALACRSRRRLVLAPAVLVFLGCVGLILDYRSFGVVCLVSAAGTLANSMSPKAAVRLVVVGALAACLAIVVPAMIAAGIFGDAVRERTLAQGNISGPMLLAGRTEPPLSLAAISERPVIGWGDAQQIGNNTVSRGAALAWSLGMQDPKAYLPFWIRNGGAISLHSVLFGSWVEGGVLAAALPIALLCLFATALVRARGRWGAVVMLVASSGIWNVIFSPWSGNLSVQLAGHAIVAAYACAPSKPRVQQRGGVGDFSVDGVAGEPGA